MGDTLPSEHPSDDTELVPGRYKENPLLLLGEFYALDVIGCLTEQARAQLEQMDCRVMFHTRTSSWKEAAVETFKFHPTVDKEIKFLWWRHQNTRRSQGFSEGDPKLFAQELFDGKWSTD